MEKLDLISGIMAMYQRHGWKLRHVLLRPETAAGLAAQSDQLFGDAEIGESDFDALWFARPSDAKREAWELRLISEQPYALFEAFEADEPGEDREQARREMENRMREYASNA